MKLIKEFFKGKFLGHPIHVMLVHFPMAFFPLSFFFQLFSVWMLDSQLSFIAFIVIILGIVFGSFAAIFGIIDLIQLPQKKEIWNKAGIHSILMGCILTSYIILAALDMKQFPAVPIPTTLTLVVNGSFILCLFVGAHFGGDLIYKHKVGIKED
jgi:uncharacterized membrane protein